MKCKIVSDYFESLGKVLHNKVYCNVDFTIMTDNGKGLPMLNKVSFVPSNQLYIAHISTEDGRVQTLQDHLEGTAMLAQQFAKPFNGGELAWLCGLLHDYGKYSERFQRRIRGENITADHSTPGGQFIYQQAMSTNMGILGMLVAYCIMGHHGGLPDGGSGSDSDGEPTLHGRLRKPFPTIDTFLNEYYTPPLAPPKTPVSDGFGAAFFVRMLFSSLVDADYINTEAFILKGGYIRGGFSGIAELEKRLLAHVETFLSANNTPGSLNDLRNALLGNCLSAAEDESGLFTLTAPTGSGKTIASLAFALRHAVRQGKRRVIYIVPYNTIIEQNAAEFEKIVGPENVLQHHSNVQYDSKDGSENDSRPYSEEESRKRYSTENWDYPIIVTSSVQFFESLFAARPGKCRKLHNIADSVLIFDEAQMIPIPYLKPCTRAIQELVQNYGCTAVLATATQSALDRYFGSLLLKEITENPDDLYRALRRTTLSIVQDSYSEELLAASLADSERVLCIVNSRKSAQRVFTKLHQLEPAGTFHLSTTMYPKHRSRVLKEIRDRLSDVKKPPCRVVSTSLVEAGVNLDFPIVYREEAGLDSIIQAAGRCNREGNLQQDESIVNIFTFDGHRAGSAQQANIDAFKQITRRYQDLGAPETIHAYFEQLFYNKGDAALDQKSVLPRFNQGLGAFSFPFRTVAKEFRIIEQDTQEIYMLSACPDLEQRIRNGERNRELFRELGAYSVSLYENDVQALLDLGQLERLDEDVFLMPRIFYDENFGVSLLPKGGNAVYI